MIKRITTTIVFALVILTTAAHAEMWVTVDFPGARETSVSDIDGNTIIGTYTDAGWNRRGFVYDGSNWTTLQYPGSSGTNALSTDGGTIVGTYSGSGLGSFHGFSFDGANWTPLDYPGASTIIRVIENGTIAGQYTTGSIIESKGFVYDGLNWTTVQAPGALQTVVTAMDHGTMVGYWNRDLNSDPSAISPSQNIGFIFDGINWTVLSYPGAMQTTVTGISGGTIVGTYANAFLEDHGFIYDGANWETLNFPGAAYTQISGIDGDTIWGSYRHSLYGTNHGFIYTVPEPCTLLLLGLGGIIIRRNKRGSCPFSL
jgi:hypothetical protein